MMRKHIRDYSPAPACEVPEMKGEAAFDMENRFKTRNEGGGAKLASRLRVLSPFQSRNVILLYACYRVNHS